MKKILRSIFSISLVTMYSLSGYSQLDESGICPDFTSVDILGNSHTLYNYLDSGKIVYLDVSAAWCPPCWSYHQTETLKDLYNTYGPTGTDEIMVLFVEGEGSNTTAQLYGPAGGSTYANKTMGDWVTGTPYPIIDDASISTLLKVKAFPTFYRVYPDRSFEEVNKSNDAGTEYATPAELRAREKAGKGLSTTTLDARIYYKYPVDLIDCDGVFFPKMTIQNYGTTKLNSATINLLANDSIIKTKTLGSPLNQYETAVMNFGYVKLENNSYEIKYEIINPNGSTDVNDANNTAIDLIDVNTDALKPKLTITPDDYASEVSWKILNSNNLVVASGSNYADGAATITKNTCMLDDRCYTFIIEDAYGDGFSNTNGAGGVFMLDTVEIFSFSTSDHTGSQFTQEFCLGTPPTGIVEESSSMFNIFPNPFNGETNLVFNLNNPNTVSINVINVLGEKVFEKNLGALNAGNYNDNLDVESLSKGVYVLNLTIGATTQTKKIVVN